MKEYPSIVPIPMLGAIEVMLGAIKVMLGASLFMLGVWLQQG
jgi:hypothetical protein